MAFVCPCKCLTALHHHLVEKITICNEFEFKPLGKGETGPIVSSDTGAISCLSVKYKVIYHTVLKCRTSLAVLIYQYLCVIATFQKQKHKQVILQLLCYLIQKENSLFSVTNLQNNFSFSSTM